MAVSSRELWTVRRGEALLDARETSVAMSAAFTISLL